MNTLNGLLGTLPIVPGDRGSPALACRGVFSEDSGSSNPPDFVGLVDDTELPVVDPSPSLLCLSSRLLGDGDLETLGELQERRAKLANVSDTVRDFRSRRFGAELVEGNEERL